MAVARKERRRSTLRTIRNVALGVVAALFALALVGGAMVLAMKFLGLEALVQQMDSYINEALTILRTLAQTSTFGLVTLVVTLVGGVMIPFPQHLRFCPTVKKAVIKLVRMVTVRA